MARPKFPFTTPEARDAESDDRSLAQTLEAELTRQATRSQPAARPSSARPTPVVWGAPPSPASARASTDLASSFAPADVDTDEVEPGRGARAWLGDAGLPLPTDLYSLGRWMLLLGLMNIVLSGFILMFWGIPQWESRTLRALAGYLPVGETSSAATSSSRSPRNPNDPRYRIDSNATVTGASPVTRRSPRPGSGSGSAGEAAAGANGTATRGNVPPVSTRPEPVLIPTTPDVDVPDTSSSSAPAASTAPATAAAPPATAAPPDLSRASAENALSMVQTATRADTRNPGIAVAGEAGVSMPERLPESYVRPSIATVAGAEPITGVVKLAAVVRADGVVQDLAVLWTTRQGAGLEQAALAAVRQWRYKPAMRDGVPVDARLTITVTFR